MWSEQALPTDNSFRSIFKAKLLHLKVPSTVDSIYFYPNHTYDWGRIERDILYLTHPARFTVPKDYQWYAMSLQPDRMVPVDAESIDRLQCYYSCLENMTSDAYFTSMPSPVCTPKKWKKPMLLTVVILVVCIILIAWIGKSFSSPFAQFVFITSMYLLLFFLVYKGQQNHIL
jgi:hypothetical protein